MLNKMIQYPRNKHLTLPSIEGAFSTMNILKDPPKAQYTRYVEKVFDTNRIMLDEAASMDRFCESIMPYARGVNPMVNVDYSNNAANGGQTRALSGLHSANDVHVLSNAPIAAKLPYRIMRDGAFRPPIIPQQDLLPLSRLPRVFTATAPTPTTNLVSQAIQCRPDMKSIRSELMNVCTGTNAQFNLGAPLQQPYQLVQSSVHDSLKGELRSNNVGLASSTLNTEAPAKAINNRSAYASMTINPYKPLAPSYDQMRGAQTLPIQDAVHIQANSIPRANTGSQAPIGLVAERTLNRPYTHMTAQLSDSRRDLSNTSSGREYTYLSERASRGGCGSGGGMNNLSRPVPCDVRTAKQRTRAR